MHDKNLNSVYRNPELAAVKLAQAKYFLLRVAEFKKMVSEKFKCAPSVIIVGDFNSVPGSQVHILSFLLVIIGYKIIKFGLIYNPF